MILLIDNYDSFVHNLARYFQRLGQQTRVVRNDAIDVGTMRAIKPDAIVLSPGPCTPNEAGCSLDVVTRLWKQIPIMGVCLGHQTIAVAFGATIVRSNPMHGRTSDVFHDGQGVFSRLPNPLVACRYHSLVVDESTLPDCLEVTARTSDGVVMGIRHREHPVVGVQFHPESILTEAGYGLLANFLQMARINCTEPAPSADELRQPAAAGFAVPNRPVTF